MATVEADYAARLRTDAAWRRRQMDLHFSRESDVYKTLERLARRLDDIGVPYALVGGLALGEHGFVRGTNDIDLLVTPEGLRTIHERLEGLGYLPPFSGSKDLKDTSTGVRIEFLITGQFPGDGKPQPVAFPDPATETVEINGIKVINLPKLIELKLASGMTGKGRVKDLGDVQQLMQLLSLPRDFALQLNPAMRGKFDELWVDAEQAGG